MTANTTIEGSASATTDRARRELPDYFARFYEWLVFAASRVLNNELRAIGLDECSLVHNAFLRLSRSGIRFSHEGGFRAAARRTLERAAIDHARANRRIKRGGRRRAVPLDAADAIADHRDDFAELEWNDLLSRLDVANPRLAQIAKHLVRGDDVEAIARNLAVSPSTVRMSRMQLRGWLKSRVAG